MKRNRRLDTIDKEFTKENLRDYFEGGRQNREYVSTQVYGNGVALLYKPKNEYQSRFYGKLYRMQVVQKYRFQYKYVRYKEDLQRMRELQEEYLFIRKNDIANVADLIRAGIRAEEKVKTIDAQKKELYQTHARQKYQYEKDGDKEAFLWQEAEYREKLAELKESRKEAKKEYALLLKCVKEKLYGYLGIPLDVDIENVYEMVLPEYREKEKDTLLSVEPEVYTERTMPEEVVPEKIMPDNIIYENEAVSDLMAINMEVSDEVREADMEMNIVSTTDRKEESEKPLYDNKANLDMDEVKSEKAVGTKEWYESLTDKEKVVWLGIMNCSVEEAILHFISKLKSVGIEYSYGAEALEEFMRLENVAEKISKEKYEETAITKSSVKEYKSR